MARQDIDTFWDRQTRNDINENFKELYEMEPKLEKATDFLNDTVKRFEQGEFVAPGSITPSKLSFAESHSKNLFDGDFVNGLLYYNTAEEKLVPVYNYNNYRGKIAIVKLEPNTDYVFKVHDWQVRNIYRAGVSREYPKFQEKGSDLTITKPVPSHYYTLDKSFFSDLSINEYTFNSGDYSYLSIYCTNNGVEPRIQVEKGTKATDYVDGTRKIPARYLDIPQSEEVTYPDDDAKAAFIQKMNDRAARMGMRNAHFVEPAGYPSTAEQQMSTRDMITLGVQASGYKELARVWGKETYTFTVLGPNKRELTIDHSADFSVFKTAGYHVFGAKTGGIATGVLAGYHLFFIVNGKDRLMVGTLRGSTKADRFNDLVTAFKNAENGTNDSIVAESASVCYLPYENPFLFEQYDVPLLFSKSPDASGHPASITKIMSAIIALDYLTDMNERITIKESDVKPGTGNVFEAGDIITVKDALYSMMLPSSNTATHAVARIVGNMIMNNKADY